MRIGIVGGRLQGLEAAYLSREAGYHTTLIDRDSAAPARSLVNRFVHLDLLAERDAARSLLREFNLVIPATERRETLLWLNETARECDIPLALDLPSYSISCSKIRSNDMLRQAGIPIPQPWPQCGFPVIVKPSDRSGSAGVSRANTWLELTAALADLDGEAVIQKYLDGPSYSLEVLAHRGSGIGFQVTQLEFDASYDCKRVLAGPRVGQHVTAAFHDLGDRIAETLGLSGIMDVEVMDTGGRLEVLEIDARLPSQTPSAVLHATGINLVEALAEYWVNGRLPRPPKRGEISRAVVYEHYRFRHGTLEVAGEHVLTDAQALTVRDCFFSAEIFVSNFERSRENWVATAVYSGETEAQAWEARSRGLQEIRETFDIRTFLDPTP